MPRNKLSVLVSFFFLSVSAVANADQKPELAAPFTNNMILQRQTLAPGHKEAWGAFYKSLEDQIAASESALKKGEEAKEISAGIPGNLKSNRDASWLFNGRLSPVVPFAIRGAIWNQGYANMGEGLAAAIGNSISAKTGRPVGIIFLKAKKDIPIKNWIAPIFLNDAPSLMEDSKTVGSQYFDNPYYLANVRRYIAEWQAYWGEHIPAMMETKAVASEVYGN